MFALLLSAIAAVFSFYLTCCGVLFNLQLMIALGGSLEERRREKYEDKVRQQAMRRAAAAPVVSTNMSSNISS